MPEHSTKEWRVHIGAHKTATTHVQDTLEHIRYQLAEVGIEYIPRQEIRTQGGFPLCPWWQYQPLIQRVLAKKPQQNHWIESYEDRQKVLLLSEENLLGSVSGLLRSPIYPDLEKKMAMLGSLKKKNKLTLFLAIRSFDSILPSAYGQQARMAKAKPGAFDAIKKIALKKPSTWSSVIGRILKAVDVDQLKVWKYEDYICNQDFFLANVCKNSMSSFPHIPPPPSTRSPSAEAIRLLEKINPRLSRRQRTEEASLICSTDNSCKSFRPFSAAEVEKLRSIYEEDILLIEKKYPGVMINLPC